MLWTDIDRRLHALLSEIRESIHVNERLLSESASRVASSRRQLNRSFGMSGSSDTDALTLGDQPTVPRRPQDPGLREKVRQAIDRKQMPTREPDCTAPGFWDTRGGYQDSAPVLDRRSWRQ